MKILLRILDLLTLLLATFTISVTCGTLGIPAEVNLFLCLMIGLFWPKISPLKDEISKVKDENEEE